MTLGNREVEEMSGVVGHGLRSCRVPIGMTMFHYLMLE